MIYLLLYFEFFKAGLFAVGGAMATVPFLFDISRRTGWFTIDELANMIAVSESTPGPIGINMATYVGFHTSGICGALASTLGLLSPSVLVILLIAVFLEKFSEKPVVKCVFAVLRAATVGLISYAVLNVFSISLFNGTHILPIPCIGFAVLLGLRCIFKKIHPAVWILAGAIFGLIFL